MSGTTNNIHLTGTLADAAGAKYPIDMTLTMPVAPQPPQPGQPSPDGTKVTNTTTILTDDNGAQWKLFADPTLGNVVQWQPKGATSFTAAGFSQNVTGIEKWKTSCAQWAPYQGGTGWWIASVTGTPPTVAWQQIPGDPSVPTPPNTSGVYQIGPGGIVDPNGRPFRANGMNIMAKQVWGNGQFDYARASGAKLRSLWGPNFNFVRFADLYATPLSGATHPASDANIRNWVADLNAHGIIVYAEVHYTGNYATGQALNDACSWLAEWANQYKNNPMVWLGSQNEPHGDGPGISHMMVTMYNAARGQGFNGPFGHCLGNPGGEINGMNPADFTGQTNSFMDGHFYGWNITSGVHFRDIAAMAAQFHNQQGAMNCLCLETGDATDGNNRDANWQQVIQEAYANPAGAACWYSNWSDTSSGADRLLASPFDYTVLTDYGQYAKSQMH